MIRSIVFFPFYLLSIFTQAKSFKSNPVVGSIVLNYMGLHVIRLLFARAVFNIRLLILSPLVSKEDYKSFKEKGYLLKQDILSQEELKNVVSEVREYSEEIRLNIQGNTLVYRSFLIDDILKENLYLNSLRLDKNLLNLLKFTSGKNDYPRFYIEKIEHGSSDSLKEDPQKNLHSDTFHPTMKAWLFLEDVEMEDGPFNYVESSNKLTWKRIKWEYKRSVRAKYLKDGYSEKGSFRAWDEDLEYLGLSEPKSFAVKAGTLVIANTNGFHRRGVALDGRKRLTLWFTNRSNPFNPFIGFGSKFLADIRDSLFVLNQKRLDKKALISGKNPSWKKIDGKKYQ